MGRPGRLDQAKTSSENGSTDGRIEDHGPRKNQSETKKDHKYRAPDGSPGRIQLPASYEVKLQRRAKNIRAGLRIVRAALPKNVPDDELDQRILAAIADWDFTGESPEPHPSWFSAAPQQPGRTQTAPVIQALIAQAKAERKIAGPAHEQEMRRRFPSAAELRLHLLDMKPLPELKVETPASGWPPEPPDALPLQERMRFRSLCQAPYEDLVALGRECGLVTDRSEPEIRRLFETVPALAAYLVKSKVVSDLRPSTPAALPTRSPFAAGLDLHTRLIIKNMPWPLVLTRQGFYSLLAEAMEYEIDRRRAAAQMPTAQPAAPSAA